MLTSCGTVPEAIAEVRMQNTEVTRKSAFRSAFCILTSALVLWLLFFHGLADRDLWSSHEARAGQDAQTILHEGRWGLPGLYDGQTELQKPPLYYWLVALVARCQGGTVDAWSVRLPAALAALGGVLLVFGLMTARGRPLAGLIAAAVLATALHYTWLARVGRIDMPLALAVGTAVCCFFLASGGGKPILLASGGRSSLASGGRKPPVECDAATAPSPTGGLRPSLAFVLRFLGYLAIAAAVMLKGPIGAVLPAVVLAAWTIAERRGRSWRELSRHLLHSSLGWGVPLVLALVLPWYLWADAQTGGKFLQRFLWFDNVERAFGGDDLLRGHPFWFYGPRFLVDFLPWSPLVLVAGWWVLRNCRPDDPEARFGLVWLVSIALLLSLVRFKRADYLLPAYTGAALLLGCMAERCLQSAVQVRRRAAGFAALLLIAAGGWFVQVHALLPAQEPHREQRSFAAEIRRRAPLPGYVLFFRAESHALAFHVGRPLYTFLEWENLDVWAGMPGLHYVVMPPECAVEWPDHVTSGRLEEVLRNTDLAGGRHEQPLVLMRIDNRNKAQ